MKRTLAAIVTAMSLAMGAAGCSYDNDAVIAAKKAGWKNVRVYEVDSEGKCDERDTAYKVTGWNPEGEFAEATACCSYDNLFNRCVIRAVLHN